VDSREKAEDLYRRGELTKLLLLPAEFGGQDIPINVVYVPGVAAELKRRIDANTIKPLAQKGQISRYKATPEYEGKSFIPSLIRISATDPGRFEGTVAIWGKAVLDKAKPVAGVTVDPPAFTPAASTVEGLGPEDFVRAFIADYEGWNNFAYQVTSQNARTGMAASESAYDALLRKYCLPDLSHQPIAFGSESSHDLEREAIVSADVSAESCVVKTRRIKKAGTPAIVQNFEYHLKKIGQRWFLTSILYAFDDGKYEGL
jgi:hypothetical protein